jgi:hypothetical protein
MTAPQWEKTLPDDYLDAEALKQYQLGYRSLQESIYLN